MPDYFTHNICARVILERCEKTVKQKICDRYVYLLGAQGGDVFFAYKLSPTAENLGRRLHAAPALDLFEKLACGNKSYACGFATHYALDCTLHPAIYAFERAYKKPLAHMRFENDLGLHISRKFKIPRGILPRERILGASFAVYDAIKRIEPQITLTGVERCLARHFLYSKTLVKTKRQSFAFLYDYSLLDGELEEAISFGVDCVCAVAKGEISPEMFCKSFLEK